MLAALPFTGAWTEVIGCIESIGGLAVLFGLYRLVECHQAGCHRFGRFHHGHLRLCAVHHPLTPDDGQITAAHIARVDTVRDPALQHALNDLGRDIAAVHGHVAGTSGQAEPERQPPQAG